MGAAAVFETAAETPPTIRNLSVNVRLAGRLRRYLEAVPDVSMQRTQEVNHEGLERKKIVSEKMFVSGARTTRRVLPKARSLEPSLAELPIGDRMPREMQLLLQMILASDCRWYDGGGRARLIPGMTTGVDETYGHPHDVLLLLGHFDGCVYILDKRRTSE